MAKLPITILIFRVLQLGLGLAFVVFWSWSCAAGFAVGGGGGEYFFGYFAALVSITVCAHGIWSFVKKQHLVDHPAWYHHARWAGDLVVVGLWLGVILVEILVPVSSGDERRALFAGVGGAYSSGDGLESYPSVTDSIVVVERGVNVTQLFSAITFFITSLLLFIPAVRARRNKKGQAGKRRGVEGETTTGSGLQAPRSAQSHQQVRENIDVDEEGRRRDAPAVQGLQEPQVVHVRTV